MKSLSPILPIIESIYLDTPPDFDSSETGIAPTFSFDSLQKDMLYIRHRGGIDSISFTPWLAALKDKGDIPPSQVRRMISSDA